MRLSKNDIDSFPRFCIIPDNYFIVDSLCFFTGKNIKTIVKELNSEFATYYFFNNVATLDNGGFQMRQQYVEEIPLPKIRPHENDIDKAIYCAFGFSDEEILYIQNFNNKRKSEITFNTH